MWWADVEAIDGRTCKRCKTWKPLNNFSERSRRCRGCVYEESPQGGRNDCKPRYRAIVITDLGRQTLREMEAVA